MKLSTKVYIHYLASLGKNAERFHPLFKNWDGFLCEIMAPIKDFLLATKTASCKGQASTSAVCNKPVHLLKVRSCNAASHKEASN